MLKEKIQPLSWVDIDLKALSYNLNQIRQKIKGRGILAVVKSDAYGHGAREVSRLLAKNGVAALGVATVAEAKNLREGGIKLPVAVLSGILPEQIEAVIDYRLIPTISDLRSAQLLSKIAKKKGKKVNAQVKIDTGMHRLGVGYKEAVSLIKKIKALPFIHLQGIFTHFVSADEKNKKLTDLQIQRFQKILDELKKNGIDIPWQHAANSAAILDVPQSYFNMVRPGLILYGCYPSGEVSRSISLRPVMSLKSKVIFLKKVSKGCSVSYGHTWRAKKDTIIGILPIGYSVGYSRFLSNRGEVIIKGKKFPVIGRVCMDLVLVNLGLMSSVQIGDEVILMGGKNNQVITTEDMARKIGTIPYEILCLLGNRLPRVFLPV